MTDKFEKDINVPSKIMINGVDVSGCGFPDKYGYCRCYHTNLGKTPDEFKNIKCKDNPNCYYKQLKREQKLNKVNLQRSLDLNKELNNLQAEFQAEKERNEKLKTELCSFMNGDYCANGCGKMKNQFIEVHEMIATQCEKYKQALKEIRDILVKLILDPVSENPQCQGMFMIDYEARIEQRIMQLKQIFQKCEVLNDV